MALLEVRGLCVNYGAFSAVRNLDLQIEGGGVTVLLGTNGAGKTTTLNAISGAVRAARGSIRFEEGDITRLPSYQVTRAGIAHVPEGRRIVGPLTVEENLLLGAYLNRSRAECARLLDDVMNLFPILAEKRSELGGLLSGGQQQMLAFGRALMSKPKLMLLDEPSMGLAPIMVDRVMGAVATIAARGISVLMVEQNASAAFQVATTAYLLEQGELVLHGPVDEVRRSPIVLRAFLGIEDLERSDELGRTPNH